jgi:hypothetical protein
MLYLCILFFYQAHMRTLSKHHHCLTLKLLQPIICCLNLPVEYYLSDKLHCTVLNTTLVWDLFDSLLKRYHLCHRKFNHYQINIMCEE